ncbi:MAG: flagellar hook-associated protein 3 [Spirochaetales bacterium]|nr:flagellar hook-associated protein 3 [Spirochaetales bacterium]
MKRISSQMPNFDMQYHLRNREFEMNKLNNKMATQSRIQNLRDDPVAASRAVRYESALVRMEQYTRNVGEIRGRHAMMESYMQESMDIMQRIRELAVQGANGIYSGEELNYMGIEVDQLLGELVIAANARSADGTSLFSGFRTSTEPFLVSRDRMLNGEGERISRVDYIGNNGQNLTEITDGAFAEANIPGNYIFWAENMNVFSSVDATSYQVQQDSVVRIDGVDIQLREGDNIYAIMAKINDSDAPVKASLDPIRNGLNLQTTVPHQLWIHDQSGSRVMEDLGILNPANNGPPLNLADSALVSGGSVFDMVMKLRDAMFSADAQEIGGAALHGIDQAMDNLRSNFAEIGARDRRLELTAQRLEHEIPNVTEQNSKAIDLDLTEAITEFKMLEFTHKATLQTAAQIMKPSLMDYLR